MDNIRIQMNIYYDPEDIINVKHNIKQDVFNRMGDNNKEDIYNAIEMFVGTSEDATIDICDKITSLVDDLSIKDLSSYLSVDIGSLEFDNNESYECNYTMLAYLIDVEFDCEKLLNDYNKIYEECERA